MQRTRAGRDNAKLVALTSLHHDDEDDEERSAYPYRRRKVGSKSSWTRCGASHVCLLVPPANLCALLTAPLDICKVLYLYMAFTRCTHTTPTTYHAIRSTPPLAVRHGLALAPHTSGTG
jgi:hypothetical protein